MSPPDDWGDGLPGFGGPDADGLWGDGLPDAFNQGDGPPPTPTPSLVLTPTGLSFSATLLRDDPPTQAIYVTNSSVGTLDTITVSEGADWLIVWLGGSGNSQQIMNRVAIEGLPIGLYTATVTVSAANASNSPVTYLVVLTIDTHADITPLQPSIIIWVGTNGNDTIGTGSQRTPYLTIERALQDFVNGSQIRLLNGTYTPADTILVNGLAGSIFSETPGGAIIQPQQSTQYGAAIAIIGASRFTIQGVHIQQSTETQAATGGETTVGIYANDVQNFVVHTCTISDFSCPSGGAGIWALGTGRIENCTVEDITIDSGEFYGIYANGLSVMDSTVRRLANRGNTGALGIYVVNDYVLSP